MMLLSLVVVLLGIELALRFYGVEGGIDAGNWSFVNNETNFYQMDSKLIYRVAAGRVYPWETEFESDELGFRLSPNRKTTDAGRVIVAIGDSFTYGHGVGHADTYPYLLEVVLRESGNGVVVHNAGVPGYGLDQGYLYMQELVSDYRPVLVLWGVNTNDYGDSNAACLYRKVGRGFRRVPAMANTLYMRFGILGEMNDWLRDSSTVGYISAMLPDRYTFGCTKSIYDYEDYMGKLVYLVSSAAEFVSEFGGRLVLVNVLSQHDFMMDEGNLNNRNHTARLRKLVSEVGESLGVVVLDVNDLFGDLMITSASSVGQGILGARSEDYSSTLFLEDGFPEGYRHPNEAGNAVTAELLSAQLAELL